MHTVAQTVTTVQFDTALRQMADRARTRYAGEAARIDRGLVIALNGGVTLYADGTASVQSSSNAEVVYTVNGHCDCPDASRAPEGRCKHRWAKCLVKRAIADPPAPVTYYATYTAYNGFRVLPQLIETHISWVLLAGDRAYKVKKPVRFWGLLDYGTMLAGANLTQLRTSVSVGYRW